MEIRICKNNSPSNQVGKSLTGVATLTGNLVNETSIISPDIIVYGEYFTGNYAYIPDFNRYYFIENITSVRKGITKITLKCDVLQSFASEIKSNTAIVKRQKNNWNLYLNDGSFKVYNNPNVLTKAFPSGFDTQEFVLAVAGG